MRLVFRFPVSGRSLVPVFVTVLIAGCGPAEEPPPPPEVVRPVKVLQLGAPTGEDARSLPGVVRAAERAMLAFQVAGTLNKLPVKQGDRVEAGALIAELDQRDFRSNLQVAEAERLRAVSDFERAEELIEQDFISRSDYDRIRAKRDTAEAELDKARKALKDTTLRAPFGGRIARRYVQNFQEVQPKQDIVSLQDVSALEVVVDAPERLVASTTMPDDQTELGGFFATFESVPGQRFTLSIKEFATIADPDTQTFEVVFLMERPEDANILPGMTATVTRVRAAGAAAPEVFSVPMIAVFAPEVDEPHVWVVDPGDNTVSRRRVRTGELTGSDTIQVLSGLEAGETIVVSGVSRLREGAEVRPIDRVEF